MRLRLALVPLLALTACGKQALPLADVPAALLCAPAVEVAVAWPGASAEEAEATVLRPLETAIAAVPGLRSAEGVARSGEARLVLRFDGADPPLDAVRAALEGARAALPRDAEPPVLVRRPGRRAATLWVLRGRDTDDLRTLRARAEALVRRGSAEILAPAAPEVDVRLDPARLAAAGLDLPTVLTALRTTTPAGSLATDAPFVVSVRSAPEAGSLGDLVLATRNGAPVYLRDVATVDVRTPGVPAAYFDGLPAAVLVATDGVPPAADAQVVTVGPFTLDTCAPAALPELSGPVAIARLRVPAAEIPERLRTAAVAAARTAGASLVLVGAGLLSGDAEIVATAADEAGARAAAARLRAAIGATPGVGGAVLAPGEARIVVRSSHPDLEALAGASDRVVAALRARPDVVDVAVEGATIAPEVRVEPAPAASALGVRPADLLQVVRAATDGVLAGRVRDRAGEMDVRVRLGAAARPDDLAGLPLPSSGAPRRLGDVAVLRLAQSATRIVHVDQERAALVTAVLRAGADRAAVRASIPDEGTPGLRVEVIR
jgi:multidrug efflux pump subunit AcrB